MTPEEKARIKIDQWFADAGWKVVNREDYEPTGTAVAIREGLLKGNLEADYFLFINGKAVGVLEAKREETDVFASKVCEQAALYARSVPNIYQAYQKPLPFIFTSNGKELYFCDFREQDSCFKQIITIPTPHELVKKLGIEDTFAGLPTLKRKGLRDCQYEAVTELEKSFRAGQNRALMVLATGVGKTYTACLAAYRMLSYTPMRRVLFLVDRNNLGKQAEGELTLRIREKDGKEVCRTVVPVSLSGKDEKIEQELALGRDMKLWDEFSPALYDLTATLATEAGEDTCTSVFGMRHVEQGRHHIRVNGRDIHLRGVLDCCVFPLTGYPATDVKEWKRIFNTVKDYGMNHVRFHSWCPPEAASMRRTNWDCICKSNFRCGSRMSGSTRLVAISSRKKCMPY